MAPDRARSEWSANGSDYRSTISAGQTGSAWLRDAVLKPGVIRLLGDAARGRVLDVGTGGGWLFDEVAVGEAHACDIVRPDRTAAGVSFAMADVSDLPYADASFDAVVASVVLCYCARLEPAARELARVTTPGGGAVIASVHPYFYRTGTAAVDGSLRVTTDLASPAPFPIMIGGRVGPFTYHLHRPDEYVNVFLSAGWTLTRIEDAFIPRERYLAEFGDRDDEIVRATNVPLFNLLAFERRGDI